MAARKQPTLVNPVDCRHGVMRAVAGIEIPGVPVGTSALLLPDGRWTPAPDLTPLQEQLVERWIRSLGDHFRLIYQDMVKEKR